MIESPPTLPPHGRRAQARAARGPTPSGRLGVTPGRNARQPAVSSPGCFLDSPRLGRLERVGTIRQGDAIRVVATGERVAGLDRGGQLNLLVTGGAGHDIHTFGTEPTVRLHESEPCARSKRTLEPLTRGEPFRNGDVLPTVRALDYGH